MQEPKKYSLELENKTLTVEIGQFASQANAAVVARLGETIVLATAVMSKNPKEADYFPLVVDYEEKYYAAGKILGSRFIRREGRPSEEAILSARLIDRTIRPLFPKGMRNEVQIVATILSVDGKNDPDVPGLIAASLALAISDIPWNGPVAAVRVGRSEDGNWILNPDYETRQKSGVDLVVAGIDGSTSLTINLFESLRAPQSLERPELSRRVDVKINMIEAGADEISEEDLVRAFQWAGGHIGKIIEFQNKIVSDFPIKKAEIQLAQNDPELEKTVKEFLKKGQILENAVYEKQKQKMHSNIAAVKENLIAYLKEQGLEDKIKAADHIFEDTIDHIVHENILQRELRPDGRKLDELRSLYSMIGVLPRAHGTGLFQRGDTQVLSVLTLGAPGDEKLIQTMETPQEVKRFMHQYNFPPFSVGEVGRMGGAGRREIGHGALAERALKPLMPGKEEFPYTVRIVSEVLSSNGSSSMASVCGSTLALMDGGVPVKKPAAGIAMGVMIGKNGDYKVLTDIQGPEDHYGDMDFKVAGTADGITALQMDVKVEGISAEMLDRALAQAKKARLEILENVASAIVAPRAELSPFAPRVISMMIPIDKIRDVIGSGGKVINDIIAKTGATIDIEDDGHVYITGADMKSAESAKEIIEGIIKEYNVGDIVTGKVTQILDFGAIVEFAPNRDGMVHISELAPFRVGKVTDVVNAGDEVTVKIIRVDNGKTSLSLKALQPGAENDERSPQRRDSERPRRHSRPRR